MLKCCIYYYYTPVESYYLSIYFLNTYIYYLSISVHSVYLCLFQSTSVHSSLFWSSSVNFGPLLSIQSILVNSVYFDDALRGEVYVERWVTLLTIMSHSQCNVDNFLIKLSDKYFFWKISKGLLKIVLWN